MSSARSDPSGNPPPAFDSTPASPARAAASYPPVDPLLEQVLEQTLSPALLDPRDERSLLAVARRRAGRPLDETVAAELVRATVASRFLGRKPITEQAWAPLIQTVARTLMDDPPSHARLDRLWRRLCEVRP